MKTTIATIYECDHCRKYYKRKHFAIKHETFCKEKPENKHKCFEWCRHLTKSTATEEGDDFFPDKTYITFFCNVTGDEMHSYIAERRDMPICNETLRMPIECEHYKHFC